MFVKALLPSIVANTARHSLRELRFDSNKTKYDNDDPHDVVVHIPLLSMTKTTTDEIHKLDTMA